MDRVSKKNGSAVRYEKSDPKKSHNIRRERHNNQTAEGVSGFDVSKEQILDSGMKLRSGLAINEPQRKQAVKRNNWRTNADLRRSVRDLGKDVLGKKSLESLMEKTFRQRLPYVVAQINTEAGDCVYADGEALCERIHHLNSSNPDAILQDIFTVPVKEILFIGMVP